MQKISIANQPTSTTNLLSHSKKKKEKIEEFASSEGQKWHRKNCEVGEAFVGKVLKTDCICVLIDFGGRYEA